MTNCSRGEWEVRAMAYKFLLFVPRRLKRITALEREERKKQEKKEKKEADEESRLFPFVKFTKGVKHQVGDPGGWGGGRATCVRG